MSIETLSFVMIFCEGICIVTVRKDTRTFSPGLLAIADEMIE